MNSDILAQRLSKQITALHVRLHKERSIDQQAFDARHERLRAIRHRALKHKAVMTELMGRKERFEQMRRVMAYRRDDLDNGARLVSLLMNDAGGIDVFVDGINAGDITEVNPRSHDKDVIVIANSSLFDDPASKKIVMGWLKNKRWLVLPMLTAILLGEPCSVINLAHMVGADLSGDYPTLLNNTVRKFILETEKYI